MTSAAPPARPWRDVARVGASGAPPAVVAPRGSLDGARPDARGIKSSSPGDDDASEDPPRAARARSTSPSSVMAFETRGASSASAAASSPPPPPPTALEVTAAEPDALHVRWSPGPEEDADDAARAPRFGALLFELEVSPSREDAPSSATPSAASRDSHYVETTERRCRVSGLRAGARYAVRARAADVASGPGPWSAPIETRTAWSAAEPARRPNNATQLCDDTAVFSAAEDVLGGRSSDAASPARGARRPPPSAPTPPAPPRECVVTAVTATTARLEWAPPADGGAPVESYLVEAAELGREKKETSLDNSRDGDAPSSSDGVFVSDSSEDLEDLSSRLSWRRAAVVRTSRATLAGLRPNVSHAFRVAATNAAGASRFSAPSAPASTDPAAPSPPGRPRVAASVAPRRDAVALAWTPPAETHGLRVDAYVLEVARRPPEAAAAAPRGPAESSSKNDWDWVVAYRGPRVRATVAGLLPGEVVAARVSCVTTARAETGEHGSSSGAGAGSSRSPRGATLGGSGSGSGPGSSSSSSSSSGSSSSSEYYVSAPSPVASVAAHPAPPSPPSAPRFSRVTPDSAKVAWAPPERRNGAEIVAFLAQTRDSSDEKGGGAKKKWRTVARVDLTGDPGTPGAPPPPRGKEKEKSSFGGGGGGVAHFGAARDRSARVAGLRPGAAAEFRVGVVYVPTSGGEEAEAVEDESEASANVNAVVFGPSNTLVTPLRPPAAPGMPRAVASTPTSVTIAWDADARGGRSQRSPHATDDDAHIGEEGFLSSLSSSESRGEREETVGYALEVCGVDDALDAFACASPEAAENTSRGGGACCSKRAPGPKKNTPRRGVFGASTAASSPDDDGFATVYECVWRGGGTPRFELRGIPEGRHFRARVRAVGSRGGSVAGTPASMRTTPTTTRASLESESEGKGACGLTTRHAGVNSNRVDGVVVVPPAWRRGPLALTPPPAKDEETGSNPRRRRRESSGEARVAAARPPAGAMRTRRARRWAKARSAEWWKTAAMAFACVAVVVWLCGAALWS